MKTTLYIKALFLTLGLMTTATTWGGTAAFTGKVTAGKDDTRQTMIEAEFFEGGTIGPVVAEF